MRLATSALRLFCSGFVNSWPNNKVYQTNKMPPSLNSFYPDISVRLFAIATQAFSNGNYLSTP